MKNQTLYKVYCGTNGKWYTFSNKYKAEVLRDKMLACNFQTEFIVVPPKVIYSVNQLSLFDKSN